MENGTETETEMETETELKGKREQKSNGIDLCWRVMYSMYVYSMWIGGLCLLVVIVSLGVLEMNEKKRIKLKK